ncbi:MAG: hypothetical protein WAM85_04115 [Terracidiphilus sp.]
MRKLLRILSSGPALCLTLVPVLLGVVAAVHAQEMPDLPVELPHGYVQRKLSERLPEKPSLPPAFTIPVQPLGYSVPGVFYLGRHNRLASLDFLDEDRLLFTFQVPGLMHRRDENDAGSEERQVRAAVLELPDGKIESSAVWTVHDRLRYLWMLNDSHFLLRGGDSIQEGDATLELKPALHFPGRILWLEMDPAQKFVEVNFLQLPQAHTQPNKANDPASTQAGTTENEQKPSAKPELKPDLMVRTLDRTSGKEMLENSVGLTVPEAVDSDGYMEVEAGMLSGLFEHVQLPINSVGHIQAMHNEGNEWILNLKNFSGNFKLVDRVESTCSPMSGFVSDRELLVTLCDPWGGWDVIAMSTSGNRLWEVRTSSHEMWPLLVSSAGGARLAQETVILNHPMTHGPRPLDDQNVKGQLVRVFDAASGKLALETTASPVLDGGGNVAISPSGRRVAVLNDGAIQVFELPPPAALPHAVAPHPRH